MSIWAQILDQRTTIIPPDGKTQVDLYAAWTFGSASVPEGTQIRFVVGTGSVGPDLDGLDALNAAIAPIDGIQLFSNVGIVENQIVAAPNGTLSVMPVARVTLQPIPSTFNGSITVVAYSTYDRLKTVSRFSAQSMTLTVASGQGSFIGSMERFDPSASGGLGAWTTKSAMSFGRAGLFCQTVSSKIYAIGGFSGNFLDVVEEYDPVADSWTQKSSMGTGRAYGCSAVYNAEIYTIGGYDFNPGRSSSIVEKYSPSSDSWTSLSPLPIPLAFSTCQLVGTSIYVFYGASKIDDNNLPTVFNSGVLKYDILADSWSYVDAVYGSGNGTATTGTLGVSAAVGDLSLTVATSGSFAPNGFLTISRSTGSQETVAYKTLSNSVAVLVSPLVLSHSAGAPVVQSSLPRNNLSPGSYVNGVNITVFDGYDPAVLVPKSSIEAFNTSTNTSTIGVAQTSLARSKAAQALLGGNMYVIGGSAVKSDFVSNVESINVSSGVVTSNYNKPDSFRTGAAAASDSTYAYLVGGQSSGHDSGWLNISVSSFPPTVLADGKSSASITVTALNAGGDPPPDNISVKVRGLIYVDSSPTTAPVTDVTIASQAPAPTISILPVLFSSLEFPLIGGIGSTTLLPRSEDQINEVSQLTNFVKGNEVLLSQEQLKQDASSFANVDQQVGIERKLYNVAVEATISDPDFSGTSNSTAVVEGVSLTANSGSFFNPASATGGLSASVEFYSNITSIPDVQNVTDGPVDSADAKAALVALKKEIPFGASPHFDAIVTAAQARNSDDMSPPIDLMITASDNENSGSANNAASVVDEVNSVHGALDFPVFVTTFVVTDPVSLSARKARTDVSDLEEISTDTGGASFSIVSPNYVDFVIDRINTSAPSSIGSGKIIVTHDVEGSISSLSYSVSNLVSGNSAAMTVRYSSDGYNFVDLGIFIAPNSEFALETPINATKIECTVVLQSKSFDSPVLNSITVKYVKASIQYLFTYPNLISGQLTELAAVTNQRAPNGCLVSVGACHGESTMFDRDFVSNAQPAIKNRGIIVANNRSFDAIVGNQSFREALDSNNLIVYKARSGPWSSDAVARVFVDEVESVGDDFFMVPGIGAIVFKKKLSSSNKVTLEVQNPEQFRLGIKIVNPTLDRGKLDSFAFMWGTTEDQSALKPVSPPQTTALSILPSPAMPGGPLTASYKYFDPNGLPEDQTLLTWFRNGSPVPELNNKTTISDTDILSKRVDASADTRISRGQVWFFSVRPGNGTAFGPVALSSPVTIANNPPSASNPRFRTSNADPSVFSSSDVVYVDYDFSDKDGDVTGGDTITWYVNEQVFKVGSTNSISPTEVDKNGNKALKAGNTIRADILPFDGMDYGAVVSTASLPITSTAPSATDVSVLPTLPTVASTLRLSYSFVSADGANDNSGIAWFANGQRISDVDGSTVVAPKFLKPRQTWYAVVTPSDGNTQGVPVQSNSVVVQF